MGKGSSRGQRKTSGLLKPPSALHLKLLFQILIIRDQTGKVPFSVPGMDPSWAERAPPQSLLSGLWLSVSIPLLLVTEIPTFLVFASPAGFPSSLTESRGSYPKCSQLGKRQGPGSELGKSFSPPGHPRGAFHSQDILSAQHSTPLDTLRTQALL